MAPGEDVMNGSPSDESASEKSRTISSTALDATPPHSLKQWLQIREKSVNFLGTTILGGLQVWLLAGEEGGGEGERGLLQLAGLVVSTAFLVVR